MPRPDKKRSKLEDSSDSDSGPEDRFPAKKAKASGSTSSAAAKRPQGDPRVEGQEPTWSIGKLKMVKVREWKGRTFIDIREYYVDKNTMDTKPGKKGISLTPEQYQELKAIMPEIDQALP